MYSLVFFDPYSGIRSTHQVCVSWFTETIKNYPDVYALQVFEDNGPSAS